MEPIAVGIIGIIALLLLLALGLHIGVALGLVGIVGLMFLTRPEAALYTVATYTFYRMSDWALIVIPLFVLMGFLAQGAGLTSGLFNSARLFFGKWRGGLGVATVAGCTVFGTVTGSSIVTAVVFAQIAAPEMRRAGYDKKFAYGICSTGGAIGMLIPPSLLMVLLGVLTEQSIGRLLIAGTSPGITLFVLFSITSIVISLLRPSLAPPTGISASWRQRFVSLKGLWGIILVAGVIFGGIFAGVFSPSEAGAIACVVLLIAFLVSRGRSWQAFKSSVIGTVSTTAMIFLIVIGAGAFGRFLVLSTVAAKFLGVITVWDLSPVGFLCVAMIVYLILGCFLDSMGMMCLTLPVFYPTALALGIDGLQFSMVAVLAMEAGLVTPPVGLNVYGVKGVAESDVTLEEVFRGAFPFFLAMVVCIVFFIAFPILSTLLPSLMIQQ